MPLRDPARSAMSFASCAALSMLVLFAGLPLADATVGQSEWQLGRSLFAGPAELRGRIYTHLVDLPPAVVRCANCHSVHDSADVPRSLAPRLTHDALLLPRARRGGPPSIYTRDKLCTLLRRGIDPAFVLISVEMPRYDLDATDCDALWRYLTGSAHADAAN
jgi:hypothetical protein